MKRWFLFGGLELVSALVLALWGWNLWRAPERPVIVNAASESLVSLALQPPGGARVSAAPTRTVTPTVKISVVTPTRPPAASPTLSATVPLTASAPVAYDTLSRLSLGDIFPARDLTGLGLDPARVRVLIATGDVIPARHVDVVIRQRNDDFKYPLAATKSLLKAGDLTVINLESPLIKNCPLHDSGFTFCGRPGFAAALADAGVDVATLENNHIGNYGSSGIKETIGYLEDNQIAWADRSRPAVKDVRGVTFGFIAFNGVGANIDRKAIVARVQELRPRVDVLAVAFHWGAEYESLPKTTAGIANDNPIEIAHLAIDAGADLIIGNHPHWAQAVEIYKNKFITYALGNFIFDQMWSEETRIGVLARLTYYDHDLVKVEFLPVKLENYAQPVPMKGPAAQDVLDKIKAASYDLVKQLAAPKK